MSDIDEKLKALADAMNLLRSWHTTHLEKDHADIDKEILQLSKRLTRLEKASGVNDHGLAARVGEPIQPENSTVIGVLASDKPKRPRGRPRKNPSL